MSTVNTSPGDRFPVGQCTHYAWHRFRALTGIELVFCGSANAGDWLSNCSNKDVHKSYGSTFLRAKSVAVFPNHVCIIERLMSKEKPGGDEETPMVVFSGANDPTYEDGANVVVTREKFVGMYGGLMGILY